MKKHRGRIFKTAGVVLAATILVTLGINASDNIGNFNNSLLGSLIFQKDTARCPEGMAFVSTDAGGFCIDAYESSPGENCLYGKPGNQAETRDNIEREKCEAVSKPNMLPWTNISQSQASLICAKSGKRLPTNKEWYRSAQGTPDPRDSWTTDDCNVGKNWSGAPGRSGSGKRCVSGIGAYDMVGNAWEWVDDIAVDGKYKDRMLPPQGYVTEVDDAGVPTKTDAQTSDANFYHDYFGIVTEGTRGFLRGGYWNNGSDAGVFTASVVFSPSNIGEAVGFRCAK